MSSASPILTLLQSYALGVTSLPQKAREAYNTSLVAHIVGNAVGIGACFAAGHALYQPLATALAIKSYATKTAFPFLQEPILNLYAIRKVFYINDALTAAGGAAVMFIVLGTCFILYHSLFQQKPERTLPASSCSTPEPMTCSTSDPMTLNAARSLFHASQEASMLARIEANKARDDAIAAQTMAERTHQELVATQQELATTKDQLAERTQQLAYIESQFEATLSDLAAVLKSNEVVQNAVKVEQDSDDDALVDEGYCNNDMCSNNRDCPDHAGEN